MKKSRLLLILPVFALSSCDLFSILDTAKTSDISETQTQENNENTENTSGSSSSNENQNSSENENQNTNVNENQNSSENENQNTNVNENQNTNENVGGNENENNQTTENQTVNTGENENQNTNTNEDVSGNENQNTNTNENENQNTNQGGNQTIIEEEEEESTVIDITEWQEFAFNDTYDPDYNEYWDFYYGTTYEPTGRLWGTGEHSGIEFIKNCYIVSPTFNPWKKVECRFYFWFSSHDSTKYKATSGQPQFKLEIYNSTDTLLETKNIEITKSNVPKNNTTYMCQIYFNQITADHFILRWNNWIANGDTGYSAILCNAGLKGWPYN